MNFERALGTWLTTPWCPSCGCCIELHEDAAYRLAVDWALLAPNEQTIFLDEHGDDSYVEGLHEAVGLALVDGRRNFVDVAAELNARHPRRC